MTYNVHVKPPFNHSFHLILDALSCGMWIPVHLGYWVFKSVTR